MLLKDGNWIALRRAVDHRELAFPHCPAGSMAGLLMTKTETW